jgi:hypothetical protein
VQIFELQAHGRFRLSPAKERTDARGKFREGKWFDQVIIGAGVQTYDAVLHGVLRREYQDRDTDPSLSQSREHFDPAPAREHDIQNYQIKLLRVCQEESVFARVGNLD